jgi:hypothetical protein
MTAVLSRNGSINVLPVKKGYIFVEFAGFNSPYSVVTTISTLVAVVVVVVVEL